MSFNDYKDPIISQWHMSGGSKYSKVINNESHKVVSNMFALVGLPDISNRVVISGYVEIDINSKITEPNQFKVDYTNGYVFLHSSKEGLSINVTRYASRGVNYYPASRIYTKVDDWGNVIGSLEDTLDNIEDIEGINSRLGQTVQSAKDINTTLVKKPDGTIQIARDLDETLKTDTTEGFRISRALKDDVVAGNDVHHKLGNSSNGAIKRANDSLGNILDATRVGNNTHGRLLDVVIRANERDVSLESNIKESKVVEGRLDKSTIEAREINEELSSKPNGTTQKAHDINDELKDTTSKANTIDGKLNGTIDAGNVNISNMVDIMKDTVLVYKELVDTYSQLAVKYPSPENGWFVNAKNENKWYRYNKAKTKWEHITTFDGTIIDAMFNTSKFVWMEEIDVTKGSLTFSVGSNIGVNDKLTIIDTKYQAEWLEGVHWKRTLSTITFTEGGGLFEDLTFRVTNVGKDMKLEMDDSKTILTEYTTDRKGDLNAHTDIKKFELTNHTNAKKSELNSHTVAKEVQLDSYSATKKTELDSHTTIKKGEINTLTSSKKVEITSHADTEKIGLDGSIATASQSKTKLDASTLSANTINNTLSNGVSGTIKVATDKDVVLNATIDKSKLSNTTLGDTCVIADATNDSLNTGIAEARLLKTGLDTSVSDGTILKGELDQIIDGTDYQTIIQDVDSLKLNKADLSYVDNKVKTDVPINAKFTDTIIDISGKSNKSIKEVKTVASGGNKLTVTNTINTSDEIQVVDTKYGIKWFEGVHWNRVGQVVTFTSAMLEGMEFEVINMG